MENQAPSLIQIIEQARALAPAGSEQAALLDLALAKARQPREGYYALISLPGVRELAKRARAESREIYGRQCNNSHTVLRFREVNPEAYPGQLHFTTISGRPVSRSTVI